MKKRIISLILILVLAFTLVPSAFAADHDCGISNCVCLPGNPCTLLRLRPDRIQLEFSGPALF